MKDRPVDAAGGFAEPPLDEIANDPRFALIPLIVIDTREQLRTSYPRMFLGELARLVGLPDLDDVGECDSLIIDTDCRAVAIIEGRVTLVKGGRA